MSKEIIKLKQRLNYNPDTGVFTWTGRGGKTAVAGAVAGHKDADGYIVIRLSGKLYRAHRLAWLFINGDWPPFHLDHIDCNRENNRASNLRPCSRSENQCNRGKPKNNTSGFKGVTFDKQTGKFKAQIALHGKNHALGRFSKPEDAAEAYRSAAEKLHVEFARTNYE